MARQQVVSYTLTCDVCGVEIPDGQDAARRFGWAGSEYEVDVCREHRSELGDALDQIKLFVDAGARAGNARGARPTAPKRRGRRSGAASTASAATGSQSQIAAIRAWAQQMGHSVGERGRIPARIVDAYNQAGGETTDPAPAPSRRSRKAPVPAEV